jgi:hypothetical protein
MSLYTPAATLPTAVDATGDPHRITGGPAIAAAPGLRATHRPHHPRPRRAASNTFRRLACA